MLITANKALEGEKVMNVYIGGEYGYNRGFYSYKDKAKDIKTHYYIEYTRDQKVFDIMDTVKFDFNMLNRQDFDYLEDAISFWNSLYYDESVLHVMLFEEIILDGEIILEQHKDMVVPSVLDKISEQKVRQAETALEEYKKENELLKNFLKRYNIDMKRVIREMENITNEDNI